MEGMYDDIVEFAELEEHMDKKLKNYSSGMQVRLAFSIAIKAKNDILIFDEVLAVGDAAFQKKCMEVFYEYRRNKQTVILVTHSMDNVLNLCTRALMLEDGKVSTIGSVEKVAEAYQLSNSGSEELQEGLQERATVLKELKLTGVKKKYRIGVKMEATLSWPKKYDVRWAGIAVVGKNDEYIFGSNTGKNPIEGESIDHSIQLNLGPGQYYLTALVKNAAGEDIEVANKIVGFAVYDDFDTDVGGLTRMKYSWKKNVKN